MRIEQPWSCAALITSRTRSARADVAGVDAQAGGPRLGRLDGAAIVEMDVGDDRHRAFAHDLAQRPGRRPRPGARPARCRRRRRRSGCICSIVALTSAVSVLVIVWTLIGASPPTGTGPTMIWRDLRRSMLRQGRIGLWVIGASAVRSIRQTDSRCGAGRQWRAVRSPIAGRNAGRRRQAVPPATRRRR